MSSLLQNLNSYTESQTPSNVLAWGESIVGLVDNLTAAVNSTDLSTCGAVVGEVITILESIRNWTNVVCPVSIYIIIVPSVIICFI